MRLFVAVLVGLAVISTAGCGGQVEKNKNRDLDRPKPAAEKVDDR
jgi:hypothetical protein